jgi:peroxiredoxin
VRVVGLAQLDPTLEDVRAFMTRHQASYPVAIDPGGKVERLYRVTEHPTTVVIDRKGVVRFFHKGFTPAHAEALESAIKAVLKGERIALAPLTGERRRP